KPEHVLWLCELAGLLTEYFGWSSASSMRDCQLARLSEVSYGATIAAVDSERDEPLTPLLNFVHQRVKEAEEAPHLPLDRGLVLTEGTDQVLPGIVFAYLGIAGHQRV